MRRGNQAGVNVSEKRPRHLSIAGNRERLRGLTENPAPRKTQERLLRPRVGHIIVCIQISGGENRSSENAVGSSPPVQSANRTSHGHFKSDSSMGEDMWVGEFRKLRNPVTSVF